MQKGIIAKKDNFTVSVKYSDEAIEKKLVKFTLTKGDSLEISADELVGILSQQVNNEVLSAAFVEVDRINVVEVGRQLQFVLDKDYKKGQKVNANYTHPYPLEFALIEEAYKIAKIDEKVPKVELTKEYLDEFRKKLKPEMTEYVNKFYKSFKNVELK